MKYTLGSLLFLWGLAIGGVPLAAQTSLPGPLEIERLSPQTAELRWPDEPGDFLEEVADPSLADAWSPSLISPLIENGDRTVTIPLGDGSRYFRLRRSPAVSNRAPVMPSIANQTVMVGSVVIMQLTATDPDGDPLVFGVLPLPLPAGSSFDATTGRLEFRTGAEQVGQVVLTFTASDGYSVATQTAQITVTPPAVGATTALSGLVLDTTDAVVGTSRPISGVRVALLGVAGASTTTDATGKFLLPDVPSGKQVLDLDTAAAALAPDGSPYAGFREEIVLINGIENAVPRPFYLPRVDVSSLTPVSPNSPTVVRNAALDITLTVAPQTARLNGAPFTGSLSISLVPKGLAPAALPSFLDPGMLITIQPVGVSFTTPAPITFPNIDQLRPGTETELWSLDAGIGRFVVVGRGRVSADGRHIDTISGGIRATDWHAPAPPQAPPMPPDDAPPDDDDPDDDCDEDSGSVVSLVSGVLSTDFALPEITSLGRPQALRFVYRSDRAWPHPVLPGEITIPLRAAVPQRVTFALDVGGTRHPTAHVDTSDLNEEVDESFRVAVDFDATGLPTGAYPYTLRATSHYAVSRIGGDDLGRVVVVNGQTSPFGAGWSLDGLPQLTVNADQSVLLADGGGATVLFSSPERRDLLIQNTAATGIQRYDGVTGQLIGNFVEPGAGGLAGAHNPTFGPDGNLYVKSNPPQILRFNGATGQFMDVFIAAGTPGFSSFAQMAWGPDGNLYTDLAGPNARQVARWNGQTGQYLGIAASGQGIQRICGIAFGADGLLYVADQDPFGGTRYDRILRFNGATGAFVSIFSPSGNLDDTCPFEFGADGDIFIADQWTRDIRRFNGTTGAFKGIFATGAPVSNPVPFYARSGPDGLLYIVNSSGIHRYRDTGTPGTFVDTFIPGVSGFFTFMPPPAPNRALAYLSPAGEDSLLVRETNGRYTRHLPRGVRQEFLADGRLDAIVDRNGNRESFRYDASGRLIELIDIAGLSTAFTYANGRLAEVVDPASRMTRFVHDDAGNLERVTLPDGSQHAFGYDERHLMVSETSPSGGVVQREYDRVGRLARAHQPDGSIRTTANARGTGLPDLRGGVGTEANPLPVIRSDETVSRFVDGAGVETEYQTGRFGEGVRMVAADGSVTAWERDDNGNALRTTLPSGSVTDATYDAKGNLGSIIDRSLGNAPHLLSYDPTLQLLTGSTDAAGKVTTLERDPRGNLTAVRSPLGRTTRVTYDSRGLAQTITNLAGTVQTNTYNPLGRLTLSVEGAGARQRTMSYDYSAAGDLTRLTDSLGGVARFEYDAMGRLTRSLPPGGSVLEFGYDRAGNVASIQRDDRLPHRFRYSIMGQLAEHLPPGTETGAGSTRFFYDAAQRLARTLRADGRESQFTYDLGGRISEVNFGGESISYTYEPLTSRLTRIAAADGVAVNYTYAGERVASITWSGPVQGSVSLTYNSRGLLASVRVNSLPAVNYSYDDDGLLIQAGEFAITRAPVTGLVASAIVGTVTQEWQHDEFGGLTRHVARVAGTPILERTYERDRLGRITRLRETSGGVTRQHDFTFLANGWLGQVLTDTQPARLYTYDANGNRLSAPGLTGAAVYDAQDRLTAYGNLVITHSPEGELLRRETSPGTGRLFGYDALGRLRRCAFTAGAAINHVLDGRGRLVGREVNGALTRAWLYSDGHSPAAELDGTSAVRTVFVRAFAGAPDVLRRDGRRYAVIKDHLGSPRLVVDADSGAIAQEMTFDEFGINTLDTNPGFQPFGFAGGLFDSDLGLTRFGDRWYDAGLGRWTSRDSEPPLEEAVNLYRYAANDPVNFIDRDGASPNVASQLKDLATDWVTDLAMQSIRDSIDTMNRTKNAVQMRINEQKSRLKKLRQELARTKPKNKKKRASLQQQIKNTEAWIKELEQTQLNLASDIALAYKALNAIKFGKWVPDTLTDPRTYLDQYRARFRPES